MASAMHISPGLEPSQRCRPWEKANGQRGLSAELHNAGGPHQPFKNKCLGHPQRKPKIRGLLSVPRKDLGWAGKQNPKEKTQNTLNGQVSRVWGGGWASARGIRGWGRGPRPERTLLKHMRVRSWLVANSPLTGRRENGPRILNTPSLQGRHWAQEERLPKRRTMSCQCQSPLPEVESRCLETRQLSHSPLQPCSSHSGVPPCESVSHFSPIFSADSSNKGFLRRPRMPNRAAKACVCSSRRPQSQPRLQAHFPHGERKHTRGKQIRPRACHRPGGTRSSIRMCSRRPRPRAQRAGPITGSVGAESAGPLSRRPGGPSPPGVQAPHPPGPGGRCEMGHAASPPHCPRVAMRPTPSK